MSQSTNVILATFLSDGDRVAELQRILFPAGEPGLVSCTDERFDPPWYGGEKHLEVRLYLGAFHDFDVDRAVAAIRQVRWRDPESVQLFICRGCDQRFTEVAWRDPADMVEDDEDEDD